MLNTCYSIVVARNAEKKSCPFPSFFLPSCFWASHAARQFPLLCVLLWPHISARASVSNFDYSSLIIRVFWVFFLLSYFLWGLAQISQYLHDMHMLIFFRTILFDRSCAIKLQKLSIQNWASLLIFLTLLWLFWKYFSRLQNHNLYLI